MACALVTLSLGAWLSLADLLTPNGPDPNETRYVLVAAAGTIIVVSLAGWHAMWLIPVVTNVFAGVYEQWVWNPPAGIPSGGMDSIGYTPTGVFWVTPFAMMFAAFALVIRAAARHRRPISPTTGVQAEISEKPSGA